ncbi:Multicopper oxidase mco [Pseudovibrio axinellae]|uniref:Multicopper oxidase mco n=1 Tax=Pseudovibrio axinellae TaxID=989403 RepID=A0A161XCN0_9HYPH|nr:multicopper oxidase family protein [Pseudovibrio axinellae]KZL12498.1 Multicopper oxidase mco [Pseudovibrio axinellae]SEP69633.1 Multicopper oxidase with three cupredoxin domains (includes cell division protein FtsP and spore coat protein CotA) [Pseudovibrio axinellae]
MITRREALKGAVLGGAAVLGGVGGATSLWAVPKRHDLIARHIDHPLVKGAPNTKNMFTFGDAMPPTLRVKQGERFHARLVNKLSEPTTIHWHGMRLPNDMDGVAFLTQPYVYSEDHFDYRFTPLDAGTFWYHPHCNSLEQLSYGMTGLMVVEEQEDPGFDHDLPVNLRDFRLGSDGQFVKLFQPRKSARAGTFGTHRTSNWQSAPVMDVTAGSLVRLRLCVSDVTRIYKLAFPQNTQAKVIAMDGNPVAPFAVKMLALGPGQRADIALRIPDGEGEQIELTNYSSSSPWPVLSLRAVGTSLHRDLREIKPLPVNPIPQPDLKNAEYLPLEFSATAEKRPANPICGSLGFSFWAVNKKAWQGAERGPLDPVDVLKRDKSYVLEFINRTPQTHPIHIHGMTFKLLKSNKRKLPPWWTDTALVLPDERLQVAVRPDIEGDWLMHCHIIEHQESGMTAFLRVE